MTSPKGGIGYEDEHHLPYLKPESSSKILEIRNAIYNPSTNAIFGRTLRNWGSLLIFYSIFYSVLAAMFAACMYGLLASIDENKPTYKLDSSIIGSNPGLGYRPYLPEESGSLIWYQASNHSSAKIWTNQLDSFLSDYTEEKKKSTGHNRVSCSTNQPPPTNKVCDVELSNFGPCTKENGYSYNHSSPCVFIKLNRLFDWVPDFYNDTNDLPEDMSEDLKNFIASLPPEQRNVVWVSCYGESVSDVENIGPIDYYPKRGFDGFYYPYTNVRGYLSPLVAIHFKRPNPNILINVECRAWAKNIKFLRYLFNREGSVHFELLID